MYIYIYFIKNRVTGAHCFLSPLSRALRLLCFYQRDRKNSNWRASQINLATGFLYRGDLLLFRVELGSALAYNSNSFTRR